MTLDEMLQGGERDVHRILERAKPTKLELAIRVAQHIVGVFFPWMVPVDEE